MLFLSRTLLLGLNRNLGAREDLLEHHERPDLPYARERGRLFTRAARKETALCVRSAIMTTSSEVAPYDFRP
jgi:hypothetical protein